MMADEKKPLPPGALLPGGALYPVRSALDAIVIRCTEGDKRTDWLPIIEGLAQEGREALHALAAKLEPVDVKGRPVACTICGAEFDILGEGGMSGTFGILPVFFCPWCYSSMVDLLEQLYCGDCELADRKPAPLAVVPVEKEDPNRARCWNCGKQPARDCGFGEWSDTPNGRDFDCTGPIPGSVYCDSCPLTLCDTCRALPEYVCPACKGKGGTVHVMCAACADTGVRLPVEESDEDDETDEP